jgi:hypothetical protein
VSYALEGIEAVLVDVAIDWDRVEVVESGTGRCVSLVRRPGPDPGALPVGSGVQVPLRKRAPADLKKYAEHEVYESGQ